jgi:hypothetical protein
MTICNRLSSAVALGVLSAPFHAQAEDQAAARSLFDEGRKRATPWGGAGTGGVAIGGAW